MRIDAVKVYLLHAVQKQFVYYSFCSVAIGPILYDDALVFYVSMIK